MTDSYQDYLSTLHSSMKIREEVLLASVSQISDDKISDCKRLVAGEANEVYEITFDRRSAVIVRVSRAGDSHFDQEVWAIDRCAAVGVPVPHILSVQHLSDGSEQLDISIQEKIQGTLLSETTLTQSARRTITEQAGDYLSRIHTISTRGFGYIDGEGQAAYSTALEEARTLLDMTDDFIRAGHKAGVVSVLIERAIAISISEAKIADANISHLIHNDFCAKHIFVDRERITGIIDFGEVSGGQQVTDFVRWSRHAEFPLGWLQEGYQNQELFTPSFLRHLRVKQMEFGLWSMLNYENFPRGRDEARHQFLKDLQIVDS